MTIVVAVETSEQTHLVEEGFELSRAFEEPLHVLSVIGTGGNERDIGGMSDDSEDRLRELAAERAASAASAVADEFESVGRVAEEKTTTILQYIEEVDARYLVIGGRKRTPAGKAIFGSTTQSILLEAERPVLTILR